MVGTTSLQWWNWVRGVASGVILAGQRTTMGLRVPPKCEASSLVPLYGVLPAHPQPAWYWFSTLERLLGLRDVVQAGIASSRAVSSASGGSHPMSLARWNTRSRYASHPPSNRPAYLSATP